MSARSPIEIARINIRGHKAMKRIALAFLLGFVLLSLLSEVFILTHLVHEHDHNGVGGSCGICVQIHNTENLLKQFGAVITAMLPGLMALFASGAVLCFACFKGYTPVSLRTRLNN
ncbi:MAG: hypothetical protein LBB49_04525 [Gracilibacteraceae bacterium]|nr:hypothetical protein [Gracilibacteraceae bacterium]